MVLTYLEIIGGNDGGQKARICILRFPINRHCERLGVVMNVLVLWT